MGIVKLLIITSLVFGSLFAQNLIQYNARLADLQSRFSSEKTTLDSLQKKLNEYIDAADELKLKQDVNTTQINKAMASGLSAGKKYDLQKERVNQLAGLIRQERRRLYNYYSSKIDSLNDVLNMATDINTENKVRTELRKFNNLRMHVSPALPLLRFDPALVSKITIEDSTNQTRNTIYRDYLNNALSEVDSSLAILEGKTDEVRSMIRLNVRAKEFMEDVNDAQMFSMLQLQNTYTQQASPNRGEDVTFGSYDEIANLKSIYSKLEPVLGDRYEMPQFGEVDSLISEEYLNLLEDTESTLELYREMIKEKLEP